MPYLIISRVLSLIGSLFFSVGLWHLAHKVDGDDPSTVFFFVILGILGILAFFVMDRAMNRRQDAFSLIGCMVLVAIMCAICVQFGYDMSQMTFTSLQGKYFPGKIITSFVLIFIEALIYILVPLFIIAVLWSGVILGAIWLWIGNKVLARKNSV